MANENGWFIDLSLVVLLTGGATFAILSGLTGWIRVALAVPLVTLLPGYALVAALYPAAGGRASRAFDEAESGLRNPLPSKEGVDPVERFVFSVVASVAIVPAVALVANFTPMGITLFPILVGVTGFTIFFASLAILRRGTLPAERRYAPSLSGALSGLTYSRRSDGFGRQADRSGRFNLALGVCALLVIASLGYAAAFPPEGKGFTEFYVDTKNVTGDTQSMYPSRFSPGEARTLPIVVENQEHRSAKYGVVVLLQRVEGAGESARVIDEERLVRRSFALSQGETRRLSLSITPTMQGSNLRLVVLLYRGDLPDDPTLENAYRALRLPIDVGAGAATSSLSDAGPSTRNVIRAPQGRPV